MRRVDLYCRLIVALVERKISIKAFEDAFLKNFSTEHFGVDAEGRQELDKVEFRTLEDIFENLDAYSPGSEQDVLPFRLTEATFRKELAAARVKLEDYFRQQNTP